MRSLAQDDPTCRLLMTMPAVGAVVALTFKSAVDDPARFSSSKKVGPWVGLTPSRQQSGERDVTGGITKAGDAHLRRALCQAATVMMNRGRGSWVADMGLAGRETARHQAGHGGLGASDRCDPASDVAGRRKLPLGRSARADPCMS